MGLVVPHESNVGIAAGNAGQAAQYRSASAFMTPGQAAMPQAMNQLARGISTLGGTLGGMALDRQRMQNAADLLADKVAYEDALAAFESDYRETHQGVDARTAEDDFNTFHQTQYEKLQKRWGSNPYLMQGVERMAEGIRRPSMNRGIAFRDQQEQAYKKSVLDASRKQAVQTFADPSATPQDKLNALRGEEANLRLFAGQRRELVDGKEEWVGGRNVAAEIMDLRQSFHSEHVESLIASGQLDAAKKYVRDHGRDFGGKANNLTMMIEYKIDAAQRRNELAALKNQKALAQKAADDAYAGIRNTVKGLPLDEQKATAGAIIAEVKDPDVRKAMADRLRDDLAVETMRQNANDLKLGRQYREWAKQKDLLPSQALAGIDGIQGLSDEGREKLKASLTKEAQKTTRENLDATNELLRQIDLGGVVTSTQVDGYAFKNGLTDKQVQQAVKYLQEGGNSGKVTISRVEGIFKRMAKGKKMPPETYQAVLANLEPGKPATDERIKDTISNLYTDGEAMGSGWFWDKDETYASALEHGRGDTWLPDVDKAEKQAITAIFRKNGVKVTDERIRQYKKEEIMRITPRGTAQ